MSHVMGVLDTLDEKKSWEDLESEYSWATGKHRRKKLLKKLNKKIDKMKTDKWPGEGHAP